MSEPFVGEIRMFAGNFAPRGWSFCDGQLLAVSQNDALFSLLGTIYGGDGRTTFGLPDLRGRIPIHQGQGPGLSPRKLGSKAGSEKETLTTSQMPSHSHTPQGSNNQATSTTLSGNVLAKVEADAAMYVPTKATPQNLINGIVANTGGSRSHTNLMPTLCIHYIIALVGIYPSRQ
jgi:microcystin-dependent protein